jgi:hypothetical protein
MSIELDWEITDAPPEGEAPSKAPAPQRPERPNRPPPSPPKFRFRWRYFFLSAIFVGIAFGAGGLWWFTQSRWQAISADLTTLITYEEQASLAGNSDLVARLQNPDNAEWVMIRAAQAQNFLPAPWPVPTLRLVPQSIIVQSVHALAEAWMRVDIERRYTLPDGRVFTFQQPQFYLRNQANVWRHAPPPGGWWGEIRLWESAHLRLRYYAADQDVAQALATRLEVTLAEICATPERSRTALCARAAQLYLSPMLETLRRDPLDNVQVALSFPEVSSAPDPGFYVSVPSPHLTGLPADDVAEALLADYYLLRLLAALAKDTQQITDFMALFEAYRLRDVDPGFWALLPKEPTTIVIPFGASTAPPRATATPAPSILRGDYIFYEVQTGDTLLAIARRYKTTVEMILALNAHLTHPDQIAIGMMLTLPRPPE